MDGDLVQQFWRTLAEHEALGRSLASLAERLAIEAIVDALSGAAIIEVRGARNEDLIGTLRVRRVLGPAGEVLYDVAAGHDDRHVEDTIDEVNTEYLDLLLDLTGDRYLGDGTLSPVR